MEKKTALPRHERAALVFETVISVWAAAGRGMWRGRRSRRRRRACGTAGACAAGRARSTPTTGGTTTHGTAFPSRITRDGRWNAIARWCAVPRRRDRACRRRSCGRSCVAIAVRPACGGDPFAFPTGHSLAGCCCRAAIRVYKAMFPGIVSNRRIFAGRNDASASTAFKNGSGNANRRRSWRKGVVESFFGSGLQRFPFLSRRKSDHAAPTQIARGPGGENAALEVQGSLALGVERMHGDETYIPLVVNEHRGHRMIDRPGWMNSRWKSPDGNACSRKVAVNDRRRVKPSSAA